MTTTKPNSFVITGGPGAGKTSIIEALRARGYATVDEVGRAIIRAQLAIGGDALHGADRAKFAELMLSQSILDFERAGDTMVFFDRGITELVGYWRLSGMPVPDHFRNAARLFRTNAHVFVAPPWEEIYRNDDERKQTFSEAVATCEFCVAAYAEAGYETVEVPKASLAERVEFVLNRVKAWTMTAGR